MARTFKEEEYAARRGEILDVVQRLVYTRGYEKMSIQDILQELQISKGAFYHYFDSKPALLEAMVERIQAQAAQQIFPILTDPNQIALEKLQHFFDATNRWKLAQKEYMLGILRIWYHDDNAIVRQKMLASSQKLITPYLAQVIQSGIEEGVFTTPFPDEIASVVMTLMIGMGDSVAGVFLQPPMGGGLEELKCRIEAYSRAIERVLNAPPCSIHIIDDASLRAWFTDEEDNRKGREGSPQKEISPRMDANKHE
jgi:TetR/AcrR family transcriptional regulator, transcriptional repressor for nem operon